MNTVTVCAPRISAVIMGACRSLCAVRTSHEGFAIVLNAKKTYGLIVRFSFTNVTSSPCSHVLYYPLPAYTRYYTTFFFLGIFKYNYLFYYYYYFNERRLILSHFFRYLSSVFSQCEEITLRFVRHDSERVLYVVWRSRISYGFKCFGFVVGAC